MPQPVPLNPTNIMAHQQTKNINRKSSKPILNWLQRKLGGSHRGARRPVMNDGERSVKPHPNPPHRIIGKQLQPPLEKQNDINMAGVESNHSPQQSSTSVVSSWGNSNAVEADEDASIRPIPPTSPPSPVPSRSSSSFVSDPRTFMSGGGGSTRPTTLLSVDLGTNGMAHIAQAPSTPTSVHNYTPSPSPIFARFPSSRASASISSLNPTTSAAVTFSALPPSNMSTSMAAGRVAGVQAPLHTHHHPRNNPRPSSPPNDNASILTLASSAYATPRYGTWAGDSQSQLAADNLSHAALDELQAEERDLDASVRALRPRSSRRGSWDSEVSGWSANSPAAPDKSLRTAPSVRTTGWLPTDDGTRDGADDLDIISTKGMPWDTTTGELPKTQDIFESGSSSVERTSTVD